MSGPAPSVWVLHDGKPGMASQALGLAEADRLSVHRKAVVDPPPVGVAAAASLAGAARRLRPRRACTLAPPWPDLVIGCGRNAVRPALAIRRASGGRTLAAQIQDPRVGRGEFDMLFVPEHDRLRGRANLRDARARSIA